MTSNDLYARPIKRSNKKVYKKITHILLYYNLI